MGSANDNVTVRIVGDASGVKPAVDQTKGSIAGVHEVIASLNAQLGAMAARMREAFAAGAGGGQQLASGMNQARVATEAESNALTRMVMKVHEGAESVRTFQMRAKAFAEVYVGIFAVEAVAHWAEALGKAAEKTEQLSAKLGMTVPEVQALGGAATMSGTNIDALAKGLGMMDNRAVTSAGHSSSAGKAFKAMGIDARDGSTNMQRLLTIADKFHGMEDGPTKVALAMQLFGRSGREMIPFLNQGSAAIEQLMQKSKDLGAVDEAAVEQGARLASSVNESTVAWTGLKNILTEGFGPLLTEIVDGFISLVEQMKASYDSGGLVKQIFEVIVAVIEGLGEMVSAIAEGFQQFFSSTTAAGIPWKEFLVFSIGIIVKSFKVLVALLVLVGDSFVGMYYVVKSAVETMAANVIENVGAIKRDFEALGNFLQVVGKVCEDALMLHWGSIQADWDSGMKHVEDVVNQRTGEILKTTAHLRDQARADFNSAMGIGDSFDAFVGKMFAPAGPPKHDDFKFKFGGGGGEAPDITNPEKGKKGGEKTTIAEKLEAELEAKKLAWSLEQDAQGTFQQYSLQSEADFWAEALKRTDLNTKDKLAIEKKYLEARSNLKRDEIANQLEGYQIEIQAAGANWDRKLAILREEEAYVVKMYGAESKEAKQAAQAVIKAEQDKAKHLRELEDEIAKGKEEAALAAIDAAEAAAEFEVQMGRERNSQILGQDKQFENQRYEIRRAALLRTLALMKQDPTVDAQKLQQLYNQIEALDRQHQQKLTQIDRQAELDRSRIQRGAIQQTASGWANAIAQMITLQQGLSASIKSIWQTIQQTIASAIEAILDQWLTEQLSALILGKAQKIAAASGEIAANAAVAASGAYAATAAIPFIGPALAPAAAASAYGGAISWLGALTGAGAEGGWWEVQPGLSMLHAKEMVLPAWAAEPLRNMLAGGHAANFNAPAASNDRQGGDVHLHLHGEIIHNPGQLRRWFEANHHAVGAGVRQFVRQGGNTSRNR
jgi:hypothetical protein